MSAQTAPTSSGLPSHRVLGVGLVLAIVLIAAASAISLFAQRDLREAGLQVDHTRQVLYQIERLHSLVKDTGAGLRNYLISGDAQFLDTAEEAVAALPTAFETVRRMTADNPRRQSQLDTLKGLIDERLAQRRDVLAAGATRGEAALTPEYFAESQAVLERIREIVGTMTAEETALGQVRRETAERRARVAGISQPGVTFVSLAIIALLFLQMYREVQRRRAAEGALRNFNQALEQRVRERTDQLELTQRQYRNVVDLVQEAIWVHVDGVVTFANAAAARLFGTRAPDEVIGRPVLSLFHPDDIALAQARTQDLKARGGPNEIADLRFLGADGVTRIGATHGMSFVQDGKTHIMGSARDVTAVREAEGQLHQAQKMEAVGQLTGGVAHDFNNLLTVVIGRLDATVDRIPPDLRPAIQSALEAAERGADLIRQMLAFSRRQVLAPAAIDLNRLMGGMEELLRRTLGADVELEVKRARGLWSAVADKSQVENALLNLAINARDAMPGGGKLTIETENKHLDADYAAANAEVTPGDYVMLAVTDTGTGMSPEVMERAFEPFFTTKEVGKGTGLGLSMVYGFAKQSGGHLKIYSELGHGTTVRLYLPRNAGDARLVEEAPPVVSERPRGGETILVVEDDPAVRAYVVAELEALGYHVMEGADGQAAQEILRIDLPIDLLFTDVVMPGNLSGRQLADEARRRRPDLKILFTSGYTESSIVHQGKLDPGVIFLSKPYRGHELARKVREALEAR